MEQTLELLGIKTDLLTSKPLFTRLETEEIFGCTHQTLKSFERRELIKPSRFKNKNFYSANEILSCIKKQIPQACKISKEEMEWNKGNGRSGREIVEGKKWKGRSGREGGKGKE